MTWILWLIVGVVSILGGVVALANPVVATLAAMQLVAWIFIVVGFLEIFAGLFARPTATAPAGRAGAGTATATAGRAGDTRVATQDAATRPGWGSRVLTIVLGVIVLLLGVNLLANPLAGIVTLTIAVAILLLAAGLTKIALSFSIPTRGYFWLVLLSGILSLILAVMIFGNFAEAAATLLGIILAVELISNGVALVMLALDQRQGREVVAGV